MVVIFWTGDGATFDTIDLTPGGISPEVGEKEWNIVLNMEKVI